MKKRFSQRVFINAFSNSVKHVPIRAFLITCFSMFAKTRFQKRTFQKTFSKTRSGIRMYFRCAAQGGRPGGVPMGGPQGKPPVGSPGGAWISFVLFRIFHFGELLGKGGGNLTGGPGGAPPSGVAPPPPRRACGAPTPRRRNGRACGARFSLKILISRELLARGAAT